MQILIVVTHLLGTGHLKRSINLGQAFVAAGHKVTIASGGYPVSQFKTEGVSVVQLPPVGSDGIDFSRLLKPDGSVADKHYLESRGVALHDLVQRLEPSVVITELFPFGRRILQQEFTLMLRTAKAQPVPPIILASVRDILSPPSSAKKAQQTEEFVSEYFHGVLVHSNESSTPLEISWPVSRALAGKLHYTGYVAPVEPLDHRPLMSSGEIVVSAGGGAVGAHLFETAVKAAWLTADTPWRLLVGGQDAAEEVSRLQRLGVAESMTIEVARTDFRQLLLQAQCSVSLCGYNTAVDLLQTGTPGVLVPFDDGGELEQILRAESLSKLPSFSLIKASELTPGTLIKSINELCKVGHVQHGDLGFDGASEAVRIAATLADRQSAD